MQSHGLVAPKLIDVLADNAHRRIALSYLVMHRTEMQTHKPS